MRGIIYTEGSSVDALSLSLDSDTCFLRDILNRPLIYYSISLLAEIGIRNILITAKAETLARFQEILGSGQDWGLQFSYLLTRGRKDLVESLLTSEEFVGGTNSCLIMGDKVFLNTRLTGWLPELNLHSGVTVLIKPLPLGFRHFEESKVGLVVFDSAVFNKIRSLQLNRPSLYDVLKQYDEQRVRYTASNEHTRWLDIDSSSITKVNDIIEKSLNSSRIIPGCPEEVCWRHGLIDDDRLENLANLAVSQKYGSYLLDVLKGKRKFQLVENKR
ncbi:MAG: sugar phosphate nucleotidyltransferase [Gammaproteobacteria bacterium]|nr:sugar phosphate nucleotidyltransferase [Gammaproteobacteria bacterium]MCY4274915.1 sugar phosphate nucleotidyltransferase [Gammaproteobacteria bacterium]